MIDFRREQVVSLENAAKLLPPNPNGTPVHRATVFRWSARGLRGVKLETLHMGGRRCTTVEALQRFFERLTAADADDAGVRAAPWRSDEPTDSAELDKAGY